jgi:hypothetical protein
MTAPIRSISGHKAYAAGRIQPATHKASSGEENKPRQALITVLRNQQETTERSFSIYRHETRFITQLIACNINMPQTRQKRRSAPEEAIAHYQQTDKGTELSTLGFSRTL